MWNHTGNHPFNSSIIYHSKIIVKWYLWETLCNVRNILETFYALVMTIMIILGWTSLWTPNSTLMILLSFCLLCHRIISDIKSVNCETVLVVYSYFTTHSLIPSRENVVLKQLSDGANDELSFRYVSNAQRSYFSYVICRCPVT